MTSVRDPHSYANIHQVQCKHIHLELTANFEAKHFHGYAELELEGMDPSNSKLVLDTRDLEIHQVMLQEQSLAFQVLPATEAFGAALEIDLPSTLSPKFRVTIHYQTTPKSSGIQWLTKEQTADKQYPYMFTQAQAIHARSFVPCQDCPSAKITYSANITVPKWAICLMSAVQKQEPIIGTTESVFSWEQTVPIPSYLIAFVIGHMESRDIGPRTRVWSEPSVVDAAAYEFQQTEEFIQHAETIMAQEYVWGRYDLVCLPPSFPYGGMENPCLTFVTPTLLTVEQKVENGKPIFSKGRELVDVVAHEIAHSWTGNLITNHTWEHFWLNEGWTVWLQRKIMARVHSKAYFDFDATIGWKHLRDSVQMFGEDHTFTALVPNVTGVDPDDSFSSIPYEKGFNFLYYLSRIVGEEKFEAFAQAYVQKFKFKTLITDDFCEFFKEYFTALNVDYSKVDWDTWVKQPGMPKIEYEFDTAITSASYQVAQDWLTTGTSTVDTSTWTSAQMVIMLEKMLITLEEQKTQVSHDLLAKMNATYQFQQSRNAEVRFCWQTLCIRANDPSILPQVEVFLKEQGRMKFVRPLYRELSLSSIGKEKAVEWFQEWKCNYHPIAQKMVARDLNLTA